VLFAVRSNILAISLGPFNAGALARLPRQGCPAPRLSMFILFMSKFN
jgi:hypothetical protein